MLAGIPGSGLGYIDTFPVYFKYAVIHFSYIKKEIGHLYSDGIHSGQYHVFTKSETSSKFIEHATASSIAGPYSFVQTGDFAKWGRAEGPSITQLPDGKFRLYVFLVSK